MWALDKKCEDIIKASWSNGNDGNAVVRCMEKLDQCMGDLIKWNKNEFGHVQHEIRRCTEDLEGTSDAGWRKELFAKLREWKRREEVMWWQRSWVNYMQYGDRNMGWFHQRAYGRHASNVIAELRGGDAKWIPRPNSFKLITPKKNEFSLIRVET
ncbi:hypothetical protein Cgig2_031549 [Carnegiea gigantea]|uniref:Uncharacterized protein n=1 Tax=Carnegiea gigantea TaxID=171969 RepID=A0A9Q1GKM8_9CARY|nr:hypothetical protein Cgig2_031549 [Carnegiea gigantea]